MTSMVSMASELILFLIIILVLSLFGFREYRHELERRDLYSRLMAENLTDYSLSAGARKPPKGRNAVKAGIKRYYEQQEPFLPIHPGEGDR